MTSNSKELSVALHYKESQKRLKLLYLDIKLTFYTAAWYAFSAHHTHRKAVSRCFPAFRPSSSASRHVGTSSQYALIISLVQP